MSDRELRVQAALQRQAAFEARWNAMTDRAYQVAEMRDFGYVGPPESPSLEASPEPDVTAELTDEQRMEALLGDIALISGTTPTRLRDRWEERVGMTYEEAWKYGVGFPEAGNYPTGTH